MPSRGDRRRSLAWGNARRSIAAGPRIQPTSAAPYSGATTIDDVPEAKVSMSRSLDSASRPA